MQEAYINICAACQWKTEIPPGAMQSVYGCIW